MKCFTRPLLYSLLTTVLLPLLLAAQGTPQFPPRDTPGERVRYEAALLRNPATGKLPDNIRSRELAFSTTLPTRSAALHKGAPAHVQVLPWTPRGPSNVGGRTRAFAIDVTNENNLLAGGVSGGMWRSIDGGQSWVRTTRTDQHITATCIVQDQRPGKTATWYYGTGEYRGNSADIQGDGIFKSTDNGLTWGPLLSTTSGTPQRQDAFDAVYRLAIDPSRTDKDIVYAAVIGGIYRSEDGGQTWTNVLGGAPSGSQRAAYTDIVVTEQGVAYATLSGWSLSGGTSQVRGIYRSTDGENWTDITPPGLSGRYSRIIPAIAPSDTRFVYFLADMTTAGGSRQAALYHYTYVSGNGSGSGGVWDDRSAYVPIATDFLTGFNSQVSYCMTIKVSPADPELVCIGGTNIHISGDGFTSDVLMNWIGGYNPAYNYTFEGWKDMMYPDHHADIHDLVFLPSNPNVLFSAGDGGVHKTLDCTEMEVKWIPLNNGYLTTQFYTLAINPAVSGDQTIIGGLQDNHTYGSAAPGTDWQWLAGGDGSYCAIPPDKSVYYVSAQQGYLCRSYAEPDMTYTDGEVLSFGTSNEYFSFIAPFLLDPNNADRLYMTTTRRVWRNNRISRPDYRSAWSPVTSTGIAGDDYVVSIALSTQPADRLYYGSGSGRLFRVDNALQSSGSSTEITGQDFPRASLQCIAVDPADADRVLVVFSNYEVRSLFYTTDGGTTWTDVSSNLEEFPDGSGAGPSCRWADIVHTASGTLFLVGTSTGLYSTEALQGGATVWVQEGATSIGNVPVTMIRTRQSDGFIAVATHGSGVFTSSAVATSVEDPGVPGTTYLEQNFPNPASGKTTVGFAIPHDMQVSLTLYDALGTVVQTPVDTRMTAGYHTVVLNTEHLADGRYYLRLQAGGNAHTRLVTVLH